MNGKLSEKAEEILEKLWIEVEEEGNFLHGHGKDPAHAG